MSSSSLICPITSNINSIPHTHISCAVCADIHSEHGRMVFHLLSCFIRNRPILLERHERLQVRLLVPCVRMNASEGTPRARLDNPHDDLLIEAEPIPGVFGKWGGTIYYDVA